MIDFIGDIHGHADKLEELLQKLEYVKINNVYTHPTRTVLFVGDYIDRGPQIVETLAIVKAMVNAKQAIALMGNHEYNAICFYYEYNQGGHLRKHSLKNMVQHAATIKQFQNKQAEYERYIQWFLTLPVYYETEYYRAVHACWDHENIEFLKSKLINDRLTKELVYESVHKNTKLHTAIEETLKGKEMKMPNGLHFTDKDGTERTEIRIKWWENPDQSTYKSISIEAIENLPDTMIEINGFDNNRYYSAEEKKVFFGHYWLKGMPKLHKHNIACLDYSVAKGGKLVAYRLQNEAQLNEKNFIAV